MALILLAAFAALIIAGNWYVWSTLRRVEKALPVTTLSEHRGMSSLIQGFSELMTSLDAVRMDPSEQRWRDFRLSLDIAYGLSNSYLEDLPELSGGNRDIVRREVDQILPVLDEIVTEAPEINGTIAFAQHARLRDVITLLREDYLLANQNAFVALTKQASQIQRLRMSSIILTALTICSLAALVVLISWQRRTIGLVNLAENTVRRSEERFALAMQGANDGLWDWDLISGEVYYSPRWKSMFGYEDDELENSIETFQKLIHPADRDTIRVAEEAYMDGFAGEYRSEFRMLHKRGQYVDVLSRGFMVRDTASEKPVRFVGTHVDITERNRILMELQKAKNAAEAASRTKSSFLANMSHELRTPLNSIIGFSEVLVDGTFGTLNNKQVRYQQHILTAGRHLLSLISDLLDLAKIEAGKMVLEPSHCELEVLIRDSLTLIQERATRHALHVALHCEGGDRPGVLADERKLKQIMFNLLSNAAKYTPDGGSIKVDARSEKDEIVIRVSDTGIGIAREDLERVFEEFEQIDSSYAKTQQGTGLGLALTRRLVELHGGRIWAESEGEGSGSTFTFTLPVKGPAEEGRED
ncbi:ATP-binding protein [Candidatus Bipolaricaulota bacterium]